MTQKDKVKELVGRGLNSYHTKALQQMDRIEKKNKEQNHKISILSNELDNDYLTKTEEGSVISLEHSKEGMVYLDELQGNTLVNYCTDGSKEITLNGDIDIEGVSVTTTEGVDNGKVDVICEGNTLVNLKLGYDDHCGVNWSNSKEIEYFTKTESSATHLKGNIVETARQLGLSWAYGVLGKVNLDLLKPNTTYTLILDNKYDVFGGINLQQGNATNNYIKQQRKIDKNTYVLTTKDSFEGLSNIGIILYGSLSWQYKGAIDFKTIALLEGDWSNREIPHEYFEGMKSVGQDDENGHKIEILSKNKNLFNPQEVYESNYSFGVPFINNKKCQDEDGVFTRATSVNSWNFGIGFHIKTEKNKDYTLSVGEYFNDGVTMDLRGFGVYKSEYPFVNNNNIQSYSNRVINKTLDSNNNSLTYNSKDYDYILFYVGGAWNANANGVKTFRMSNIEVNQSSIKPSNYTKQKSNKKEILINEPLRALPNGKKDRLIKMSNKWFVERNCGEFIFNEETEREWSTFEYPPHDSGEYRQFKFWYKNLIDLGTNLWEVSNSLICNRFPIVDGNYHWGGGNQSIGFGGDSNYFMITIKNTSPLYNTITDIDSLKTWLRNNETKVTYQLATPTYEPLEFEPTLNTYNDITHISNNSIIPCNMKIKNTGYNAIIKPNTLYTVAIGTNKGGTIGMDLGGAKGTTTNNVLKLTTPATLSDDSLRIYGKGLKGSKVRLFEGDIINIPKYFTGMQSSFEDKVQTDGSYKVEVLSNNENLFRLEDIKYSTSLGNTAKPIKNGFKIITDTKNYWHAVASIELNVRPNTVYTLGVSKKTVINAYPDEEPIWGAGYVFIREYGDKVLTEGKVKDNTRTYFRFNSGENTKIRVTFATATDVTTQKGEYDFTDLDLRESKSNLDYVENEYNKIQFLLDEPLRSVPSAGDKFIFKNGKLMIERNCDVKILTGSSVGENWTIWGNSTEPNLFSAHAGNASSNPLLPNSDVLNTSNFKCDNYSVNSNVGRTEGMGWYHKNPHLTVHKSKAKNVVELKEYLRLNPITMVYKLEQPTYEEIPFELQKIILEGYENGTLFLDTNIPPTATVKYAGETPIVKATKLNKTEVSSNTEDINDNIIPYLMDMDYRVVMLQLATEELEGGVSMARLFGGTYEMLKRDILSKRLSRQEYGYRLADYFNAGKLTEEQVRELEELR